MHQAETAKKLRGLPAFFYSHRCVPRLLDFLIALAGKLFFGQVFSEEEEEAGRKKNIATKIAQGESNSQSTVIHTLLAECKKRPNGNCKCPLLPLTTTCLLFRKLVDFQRPEGPYATKKELCTCTITTAILVLIKAPQLWPLNLRLTIACPQSIRPCNLYWIIKYVNLVFEE